MNKLFGIGLSRTGTTSLCHAMEILGYRSIHCPRDIVEIAGWCDFCNDITVACKFEILDRIFPGSKFIYTTRGMNDWLRSCERHFSAENRNNRPRHPYSEDSAIYAAYSEAEFMVYGQLVFNAEVWRKAYEDHEKRVTDYFADKKDRLLTIDVSKTKDWSQLLAFLGLEAIPFPHLNKGQECQE